MEDLKRIEEEITACNRCPLAAGRTNPVPGEGPLDAQVMFVGESPGEKEDLAGRPFVGNAGRVFDRLLENAGLRRDEVYVTGILKCRPPENRAPRATELKACKDFTLRQIEQVRPRVVCLMGSHAIKALLGSKAALNRMHGQPVRKNGLVYFPTFHPAAAFYNEDLRPVMEEDMRRLRHLLDQGAVPPTSPSNQAR